MNKKGELRPTESELEILNILWERGQATVKEVHEKLSEHKTSGYTTTLKLMQIMHEKGIAKRDDSSKTHIYEANISRDKTRSQIVKKMVSSAFGGSTSLMVMQALGHKSTTREELEEIQEFLNNLK
ncbi:MAG: BlaI/MecI/CopY family transcriptional regulator [Bacteroidetes bacterium]|nr:BlaI/MecI/CopY family transcriptional regulator [Bacteroidota bacterium]